MPNQFHVELSPQDHERLSPYSSTLAQELTEMLREHAHEQSYVFTGPVTIDFDEREDLSTGRFRVRSAALAKVTPVSDRSVTDTAVRRAHGDPRGQRDEAPARPARHRDRPRHRGRPADQRPGRLPAARRDPGAARTTRRGTDVSVVDLGSTNGMLVNGSRVQQATLDDGGTIKIGNTTMTVRFLPHDPATGRPLDGLEQVRRGCLS